MTAGLSNAQALLLDMLSSRIVIASKRFAAMAPQDWSELDALAREHRLAPLLHHQLNRRGRDWAVPEELQTRWAAAHRISTMRTLSIVRELHRISRSLDEARIPHATLKGGWLAWCAYPHPALRPLRDIDVLVPVDRAREAFELLKAQGFIEAKSHDKSVDHAFEQNKHLPTLRHPSSTVAVEIHHRLWVPRSGGGSGPLDNTQSLLARRVWYPVGGQLLPFLSVTDTLLHLIVHSAYDHRFNNGPLVLSDLAYLLAHGKVEWPQLRERATEGGWLRGCSLLLALVEHYHGFEAGRRDPAIAMDVPNDHLVAATALMLRPTEQNTAVQLFREWNAVSGARAFLALTKSRMLPSRHVIADFAGVPAESGWLAVYYPIWLTVTAFRRLRQAVDPRITADVRRTISLETWLKGAADGSPETTAGAT